MAPAFAYYLGIFFTMNHIIVHCNALSRTYKLDYSNENDDQEVTEWEPCTGANF